MTSQVKDTLLHDSHKSSKPGDDVATTGRSDSHISLRICQMSQRCFFFFSGLRPVQKHMFPLAVRCLHFHMNQSLHLRGPCYRHPQMLRLSRHLMRNKIWHRLRLSPPQKTCQPQMGTGELTAEESGRHHLDQTMESPSQWSKGSTL